MNINFEQIFVFFGSKHIYKKTLYHDHSKSFILMTHKQKISKKYHVPQKFYFFSGIGPLIRHTAI